MISVLNFCFDYLIFSQSCILSGQEGPIKKEKEKYIAMLGGRTPDELMVVTVPIVPEGRCQLEYDRQSIKDENLFQYNLILSNLGKPSFFCEIIS